MGRTYSLNGFLNAALRRSSKTVLVEGPSDKHILHKIELERFPNKAGGSTIDHAGILDDPLLAGLGNKSRVRTVQAHANTLATSVPKISSVLATLIDREWDGLSFTAFVPQPSWLAPAQESNCFTTLGHSIENYHFNADCAHEFLKYAFPEHVTASVLAAVSRQFPALLTFATVVSLKIRDDACIGRCSGLISPSHIDIRADRAYLDASFSAACVSRQIPTAGSIVADVNLSIDAAWAGLAGKAFTCWLPHGHIGDEILWCGVAKVALLEGVAQEVVNDIAHGQKKERERFKAQWISKQAVGSRPPLDEAIDWLHS